MPDETDDKIIRTTDVRFGPAMALQFETRTSRRVEYDHQRPSSDMEIINTVQNVNIIRNLILEDGDFPNNSLLPLLIYQKVIDYDNQVADKAIIELLETNEWVDAWTNGVYDYHHFHSKAHEVLAITRGSARVQFGGPNGIGLLLEKGDMVVIPAGVAHKAIEVYDGFTCIGAYPSGQKPDILKGNSNEKQAAVENIRNVPLPIADPCYGTEGPLVTNWKN